jgi:hypothetical protein
MIRMAEKGGWAGFVIILSVIRAVFMLYIHKASYREVTEQNHSLKKKQRNVLKEAPVSVLSEKNETDITVHNDKITSARKRSTIVIDDVDYDLSPLHELFTIDALPTFALLLGYGHSVDAVNILRSSKREILIHLSMELYNHRDEQTDVRSYLVVYERSSNQKSVGIRY